MENTKMKYKIFFVMMLLLTLLNNVSGYEIYTDNFQSVVYESTTETPVFTSTASYEADCLYVVSGAHAKGLSTVDAEFPISTWSGSLDYAYMKGDVEYKQGSTVVGTGYMYFWLQNTDADPEYEQVLVRCYFDDGLNLSAGYQEVDIVGAVTPYILFDRSTASNPSYGYDTKAVLICRYYYGGYLSVISGTQTAKSVNTFYNEYNYWYTDELFNFNITRDAKNNSMLYIKNDNNTVLLNETSLNSNSISVYSNELNYHIWDLELTDVNGVNHERQIDFIVEDEDITPTLTTDKSLYNTSELLTISYTNIDEMDIHGVPALFIVYPIIDDYHDYDAKFMQHLLSSKEDETFTINTSILQPQTEYYLVIADNTDWSRIESAYITSDVFYVYPDEEYLTTSCTVEGNCYTYNGDYTSIYYKVNNNSDIIVKDNDNNIIQTYYNIINEGEINYQIPFDENKLNSYPNWKIYLNNTEYSTSYNTDVTVYWSLFVTPTPTPVYTVDIPDENITEQIDQLKEESKPIFDLIYGLTTLVIDNPDYDNDNIIDEHEINNWFNSLIPLGILLLLVILYMGLKKRD